MPDLSWFPTIAFPMPIVIGGGILLAFASNCTKQVKAASAQSRAEPVSSNQPSAPQPVEDSASSDSAKAKTAAEQVAPKVLPAEGIQLPPQRQRNSAVTHTRRSPQSISFDVRGDRPL